MRLRRFRSLMLCCLMALATGCATMSVDKPRLDKIHRVAIVGFTVNQEEPPNLEFHFGSSPSTPMMAAPNAMPSKESRHADEMYNELEKVLQSRLKWKVLSREAVASNQDYQKLYDHTMKGIHMRPPHGAGTENFIAAGIADSYPLERLDATERNKLMHDLHVEALAIASVDIKLIKGGGLEQLVGAGEYKPQATTRWLVYDHSSEEPVWKDISATGEESAEGTSHVFGIANPNSINGHAVVAAESSYEKLVARMKEGNG